MQETGTMERLWQEIEGKVKRGGSATNIQEARVLGYEHVALPFLILLMGMLLAFLHLGIEGVSKKKCAASPGQPSEDIPKDGQVEDVIEGVRELLLENNSKLNSIQLVSKIRTLVLSDGGN